MTTKTLLKSCLLLAALTSTAIGVPLLSESFEVTPSGGAAWDGVGDSGQWFGDLENLQAQTQFLAATSTTEGIAVCRKLTAPDASNAADLGGSGSTASIRDDDTGFTVTIVTTMPDVSPGFTVTWSGSFGDDNHQSLNVNNSNWGGLILAADTSDGTAIEDASPNTVNVLRLVYLNGDFLQLQQSSSVTAGVWETLPLDSYNATDNAINIRYATITATLEGSVLSFSGSTGGGDVQMGSYDFGTPPSLGQYTGFIMNDASTDRGVLFDEFSIDVTGILDFSVDGYDSGASELDVSASVAPGSTYHLLFSTDLLTDDFSPLSPAVEFDGSTPMPIAVPVDTATNPVYFLKAADGPSPAP